MPDTVFVHATATSAMDISSYASRSSWSHEHAEGMEPGGRCNETHDDHDSLWKVDALVCQMVRTNHLEAAMLRKEHTFDWPERLHEARALLQSCDPSVTHLHARFLAKLLISHNKPSHLMTILESAFRDARFEAHLLPSVRTLVHEAWMYHRLSFCQSRARRHWSMVRQFVRERVSSSSSRRTEPLLFAWEE